MLTFLRKLRKSLIEIGLMRRYLLYAIGEITLVVIGILIALQVNNWNEKRLRILKSHDILAEIKENLSFNNDKFRSEITEERAVLRSVNVVLDVIQKDISYVDSLDLHFHMSMYWPSSSWKSSGYETLKSQGVEIVQSEEIRQSIIDLYEVSYPGIGEIIRVSEGQHFANLQLLTTLFSIEPINTSTPLSEFRANPHDFDKIGNSAQYEGVLSFWRMLRTVGIKVRENLIDQNNDLILKIEVELKE